MLVLADAEWNGDTADTIHVISVSEYPKGATRSFTNMEEFEQWVKSTKITKWFFHAGLTADIPVINRYFGYELINPQDVVDTFVVSRLVAYKKFATHSLKELGVKLKVFKGDYTGGWDEYSEEMREYCEQDVEVLRAIVDHYWKYISDPAWADAMRTEHNAAILCNEMQENGFMFDKEKAEGLLEDVTKSMEVLEESFKSAFPPKLVETKRLKVRYYKDGKLYKNILEAIAEYPKTKFEGDELIVYDYKEFKPGSPQDRIDVLWDAGWKPVDKTKGHIKKLREGRRR